MCSTTPASSEAVLEFWFGPPDDPGHQLPRAAWFRKDPAFDLQLRERVGATLSDLAEAFGAERPAALCRELTKLYEEVVRDTLGELRDRFAAAPPRGECTLVVAGAGSVHAEPEIDVEARVRERLATGLGPRDVAARLVAVTGMPRRALYQLALSLSRARDD